MKKIFLLIMLSGVIGCSSKNGDADKSRIIINLNKSTNPEAQSFTAGGGPWGLADPSSMSEINCVAIFIGRNGGGNDGSCTNSSDVTEIEVFEILGPYSFSGPTLTIDEKIEAEDNLNFYLMGQKSTGSCPASYFGLTPAQLVTLSAPYVFGSTTQSLTAGESTTINLSGAFAGSTRINNCTGALFGSNYDSICDLYPNVTHFADIDMGINDYLICNSDQLESIGIDGTALSANFELAQDIVYPAGPHTPIGSAGAPFTGNFEGGDHSISGFTTANSALSHVGFFSHTDGANIQNLHLINAQVYGSDYVGILIGHAENGSNIYNVRAEGTVTGVSSSGSIGGLIGSLGDPGTSLDSCSSSADITLDANGRGGSLVGIVEFSASVSNCNASGSVTGAGNANRSLGGLIGRLDDSFVSYTYSTGAVNDGNISTANLYAGGLVGEVIASSTFSSFVSSSFSTGAVTTISSGAQSSTGGLVGIMDGTAGGSAGVDSSYSTSTVTSSTGDASSAVGGLVGECNTATISESFSIGNVISNGHLSENASLFLGLDVSISCAISDGEFYTSATCTNCPTGSYIQPNGQATTGYFFSSFVRPMSGASWDFSSVWYGDIGTFPTLRSASSTYD
jgi:hypothetical protein